MALFSESLISSTGSFTKWSGSGDLTSGVNGATTTSSNTYASSSNALDTTSNTYVRVSCTVKTGSNMSIGVKFGSWGSWPAACHSNIYWSGATLYSRVGSPGEGDWDQQTVSGVSNGDVITLDFEYDNGYIKSYVNDTLYSSYAKDLSSFSTWYPYFWVNTTSDFVQSFDEVGAGGGGGIAASKRSIICS